MTTRFVNAEPNLNRGGLRIHAAKRPFGGFMDPVTTTSSSDRVIPDFLSDLILLRRQGHELVFDLTSLYLGNGALLFAHYASQWFLLATSRTIRAACGWDMGSGHAHAMFDEQCLLI